MTDTKKKQVRPVNTGKPLPRIVPWNDKGKEILARDTRQSHDNQPDIEIRDMEHFMEMLNANLQHRIRERSNKGPVRGRMKGLFGGER